MKYSPQRNTRTLFGVCLCLVVVAVVCFFLGTYLSAYRGVWQSAGLLPLCAFLFLITRFALCDYSYLLEGTSLIVVKRQGKREEKLCDIELSESIALLSQAQYKESHPKYDLCYNYCKNFASHEKSYYYFNFNGKTALLLFEPNEEMRRHIASYLSN